MPRFRILGSRRIDFTGIDLPPVSEPIAKLELALPQRQPASLAEA